MSENLFLEKDRPPSEAQISDALQDNYSLLESIRSIIPASIGETREEWKYYGKKYGWTMKTFLKKRNLFFVTICDGYFNIGFVFGDKALNAVSDSTISAELIEELNNARKYAEGRGIRIKVENDKYLNDIRQLIHIKINN